MAIADYYTSTVTRQVLSKADSVYGKNDTETWNSSTTFLARIQTLSSDELILDEARKPFVTHRGFCDGSNTVLYTDRWLVGSTTYEVTGVFLLEDKSNSHHYEVELKVVGVSVADEPEADEIIMGKGVGV